MPSVRAVGVALAVVTSLSTAVVAQCAPFAIAHPVGGFAVNAIAPLAGARLLVGGTFTLPGGGQNVAVLDRAAQSWELLGGGCDDAVFALAELPGGDLVAAGRFQNAGGVAANQIARWDGAAWHAMGSGPSGGLGGGGGLFGLHMLPNGDLIVVGDFAAMDGVAAPGVARWDGAVWTGVGSGPQWVPKVVTSLPNGDLVIGTLYQSLRRWNGTSWSLFATVTGWVEELLVHNDGSLYVGGGFSSVAGVAAEHVARWDGTSWTSLGIGLGHYCRGLTELPDGDLLVAFDDDYALEASGAVYARGLARWNGQHWAAFGSGRDGYVLDIARNADDSYSFGGLLSEVCGVPTNGLATVASGCPAAAVAFGNGCPSWAGPVTLEVLSRPWLGGGYQALVAGLPPAPSSITLALSVYGFGLAPVPLSPALPAGPGCFLLPTADVLQLSPSILGVAATGFAVPTQPALVGTVLYHQVLGLELGAGLIDVSASNGLQLTLGVL